jgi:hypothetical protein
MIKYEDSPFCDDRVEMPQTKRINISLTSVLSVPKYRSRKIDQSYLAPSILFGASDRIKGDRTFSGTFRVECGCHIFFHCGLCLSIPASTVIHVFIFDSNSVQIFTSDFRQFLFRFPGQTISPILTQRLRRIPSHGALLPLCGASADLP